MDLVLFSHGSVAAVEYDGEPGPKREWYISVISDEEAIEVWAADPDDDIAQAAVAAGLPDPTPQWVRAERERRAALPTDIAASLWGVPPCKEESPA